MDLLDRLLGHDAWTTREVLRRCSALSDAQLDREFDCGLRSVRATLEHVIRNTEVWGDLLAGLPVRDAADARGARSVPGLLARHERASAQLADVARSVARRGAWNERWLDPLDDPPTEKSRGGAIAHVLTHGMHHRAQLLAMLRRLGVDDVPEGDVLSWEQQSGATPGREVP